MLSKEAVNQISRPVVLAEQITSILQKAILEGALKEGERLIEAELQKSLSVSRSPLREAFRELEKRGFVEIVPRRGTFVKRVTAKDITDSTVVRLTLEVQAVKLAHGLAWDKVLEKMSKLIVHIEKAIKVQDNHRLSTLHTDFHNSYIYESGNEVLINFLENIYFRTAWHHFSFYYYDSDDFEDWLLDHKMLLTQFSKSNIRGKDLERIIQGHVNNSFDEYLRTFKDIPESR